MGRTRLVQFALLAALAYIGFEYVGGVIDVYRAAYPNDPVKREALDQCARGISGFSRLNEAARENCYAVFANRMDASARDYSPSHLPVNDVRRQQAFDGYQAVQRAVSIVPPPNRPSTK
jgi:hypothetical protein